MELYGEGTVGELLRRDRDLLRPHVTSLLLVATPVQPVGQLVQPVKPLVQLVQPLVQLVHPVVHPTACSTACTACSTPEQPVVHPEPERVQPVHPVAALYCLCLSLYSLTVRTPQLSPVLKPLQIHVKFHLFPN